MSVDVQQITGNARSIAQLLSNSRFGLEFYQREYSWEESQVTELIDDLSERFLAEHDPAHERRQVASYRPYFLGPIVTAQREGVRYLVDGQQRITTLSLLLIYLRRALADTSEDEARALDALIYSTSFGDKTFNLDVEEREQCLAALLEGVEFHDSSAQESVRNLWQRYETIESKFPDELRASALPYFVDWLQHRVILVEIGAPNQDMALEIFETMNDRGLRLSNTDMLKSFLLARVGSESEIRDLNDRWRRRVTELADAEKNADAEFIKAWLRGNYADTQRERKANAAPGDFDIIGTAFHKWVRDNAARIGLEREREFRQFVEREFLGLSSRYLELLSASREMTPGLESVRYNGYTGFTLQLPLILAAVTPEDDDQAFRTKAQIVAEALDIFAVRRMVNSRNFGYSTVVYSMFNLMKQVRNKSGEQVHDVLLRWLDSEEERLDGIGTFRLNQRNRWQVHYLLARMTAWIDRRVGRPGTFADYVDRSRKRPYEVEHIWANHFDRHVTEFDTQFEFEEQRNRFGGLLLLPKDFNASFGDMEYAQKLGHYNAQNTLVRSLHPSAYENNPSFLRLINETALPFRAYPDAFTRASIDERQELYREIAERVWDPRRLVQHLGGNTP